MNSLKTNMISENNNDLTCNPCKLCMPIGVVTAFYGINKCMTILHGSQGCSTYIRRHLSTHYNEPIDIASSSLTENSIIYGGERELIEGIKNLIKLYNPEVVGVGTTCLTETIGEDLERIIKMYYTENPDCNVTLVPVHSGGYMGTFSDGYYKALYCIAKSVHMDARPNKKINVVVGPSSCHDVKYLKKIFQKFGVEIILLPDISDNLDQMYTQEYNRLPSEGTKIDEIASMAGASITLELGTYIEDKYSVGIYLYETYGVPYIRMPMPIGLEATDKLIKWISSYTGVSIPIDVKKERAYYLDAMIDAHKYNAEGRVAVFGEPDFISGITKICCENNILPVVTATGCKCEHIISNIKQHIQKTADGLFVEEFSCFDNADFKRIESDIERYKPNLMIGNSDGKRIEEKYNIELIRCTFPIHDRIGGQRVRLFGYDGGVKLLDIITNCLLKKSENSFRKQAYDKYYINSGKEEKKNEKHPCFSCDASHKYSRIHLPIANECNISCNFCVRKYDCPNESRPGVTSKILTPEEAFSRYKEVKEKVRGLTVVGIAGPGDSLASFQKTKKTLQLIREYDKEVIFCLSTNGLMLPIYANEIIELGVQYVTISINAVDPKIGSKIYKNINYLGTYYTGEEGASILLANQLMGIKMLADNGIVCKVNTIAMEGINCDHIESIAKKVKELGASIGNITKMIPVEGSAFENLKVIDGKKLSEIRNRCGKHLEQMKHCQQCRADAIGMLHNNINEDILSSC